MLTLIRGFPANSRFRAAAEGIPMDHRWGSTEHLLADISDWLQQNAIIAVAVGSGGKSKIKFKPMQRPISAAEAAAKIKADEVAASLLPGVAGGGHKSYPKLRLKGDDM